LVSLVAVAVVLLLSGTASAEDPAGKKIFLDSKCNVCHSVKEADIKVLEGDAAAAPEEEADDAGEKAEKSDKKIEPPDLSGVGNRHTAEFIGNFLRKKETIDGRKHQRRFRGTPEERQTLVDWLMTLKAK
jgi:hypothetical protein